jgi:hypothetical protein
VASPLRVRVSPSIDRLYDVVERLTRQVTSLAA